MGEGRELRNTKVVEFEGDDVLELLLSAALYLQRHPNYVFLGLGLYSYPDDSPFYNLYLSVQE